MQCDSIKRSFITDDTTLRDVWQKYLIAAEIVYLCSSRLPIFSTFSNFGKKKAKTKTVELQPAKILYNLKMEEAAIAACNSICAATVSFNCKSGLIGVIAKLL